MVVHIPFRKVPEDAESAPARCSAARRTGRRWGTWSPGWGRGTGSRGDLRSAARPAWRPATQTAHQTGDPIDSRNVRAPPRSFKRTFVQIPG